MASAPGRDRAIVGRMDFTDVASQMPSLVPMVGTLQLEFLELAPQRALLRLPNNPAYHNHIGGPHAGAMFTLAESATGALVLGNFAKMMDIAIPLAVSAQIRYKRVAMGPLLAEALLNDDPADIEATARSGERPEFPITVTLTMEDGTVTGFADFLWTLRPIRRAEDEAATTTA
jgi:acyl-coenzyme A thioesterase PaaI-like protein